MEKTERFPQTESRSFISATIAPLYVILVLVDQLGLGLGQQFFSGTLGTSGIINLSSGGSSGILSGSDEWEGGGAFRSGSYGGYTCLNIPANFTLCKNMEYTKMMVPNLLGHDSLQEAEYHVS